MNNEETKTKKVYLTLKKKLEKENLLRKEYGKKYYCKVEKKSKNYCKTFHAGPTRRQTSEKRRKWKT